MDFHPLSEIFPLLPDAELSALADDIKAHGLREPIWLYESQILDGRNRWRACELAGIAERPTRQYDGDDPVGFVVSLNLHRRHLSESQRASVAAEIENMRQGERTDLEPNANLHKVSRERAAELLNVSPRSVAAASRVHDSGAPELVSALKQGKVSVSAAADVAGLPMEQQKEIVARGEREILEAAKQIRTERAAVKRAEIEELRTKALAVPPPSGQYRTIVIDPPWQTAKFERDCRPNQSGDLDYPTMDYDELGSFELPAAEECHVYVWTTQKHLPAAFELLERWGLTYVFTMVWHKPGGPQPFELPQYNCEFILFARKGSMTFLDTKQFFTCFSAPRREHSRKPDEFYDLVRRVSPGPHIDIFSREKREGFEQYGNEPNRFTA